MQFDGLEEIIQMLADNPHIGLKRDILKTGLFSFHCLSGQTFAYLRSYLAISLSDHYTVPPG